MTSVAYFLDSVLEVAAVVAAAVVYMLEQGKLVAEKEILVQKLYDVVAVLRELVMVA